MKNPTSKDWVTTIISDLDSLGLDVEFSKIQSIKKQSLKNIVKNNIKERALELLNLQKQKHSKVNMITHKKLEMQDYLLPNENNTTKNECFSSLDNISSL